MKNYLKPLLAGVAVCGMTAWVHAADGVLIAQRVTTAGATKTSQVQIEKNRMRAEMTDGSSQKVVIFDGTKQVLDIIDLDKKTYTEITKAELEQMAAQLQGAMAQMQQMMANMPPEQRAQMEGMMRGRGAMSMMAAPKTEYKKAGSDRVGKWTCEKYESYQNGQKTGEICTVEPTALGFSTADFDVARQMADFFKQLMPQAAAQMFSIGRMEDQGFSGIPVRQISGQTTTEISDVSRQSFADSIFAVPAGFQKEDMMMGMRGRGRGRGGE